MEVTLPDDVRRAVPSIPALTILKIAAWEDRKRTHPGRDAPDLMLFARSYADCDTLDRMASEHADLLESQDFDYVEAGARLLMRDITRLLPDDGISSLLAILLPEADEKGPLLLAHQSRMDVAYARQLIEAMCEELASS